jgi:2-polyprenyl-6-methoxyphenol hydroxylase-like FAD-dependent oxidoreductase
MRVLISGASIAGPTLAYWLDRYGFDTTVVERAAALRQGGYAVDFRGEVQLAVLDRMGLLDQVRDHRTGGHPARFVDETGATLLRMPSEFTGGNLEIQRADLSRLLYEHSRDRVEYRFGDSITALHQTAAGVEVTYEHAPPDRFDLVVGADGVHSRVRRLAFGPEALYVRHLGYYIAGWDLPNMWDLDGEQRFHNAPGTLAGVSEQMHRPDRANTTFIFASPADPELRGNRDRQGDLLRRVYAGQGWYVPELLAAFPSATDIYFDAVSRVEVPKWSVGRVALVGDAASGATLSGTGTGTAIIAAYVLAGELSRAGRQHTEALRRYEQFTRPYASRDRNGGRTVAALFAPSSRATLWLRNRILGSSVGSGLLLRAVAKQADNLALPDYSTVRVG